MPNGATTAKRLAEMTREKRRIYVQTHNAIWKKKRCYENVQMHRYWNTGRGESLKNILFNAVSNCKGESRPSK